MEEIFKKLLESEVLTDDVKSQLEEAFKTQLSEAIETAKTEAANQVRAELTEQWIAQRDTLIEAIDTKVNEYLKEEMGELEADIASFRDLEAEKAAELVEAKAQMAKELQSDMAELVEKLDSFLEMRLTAEIKELKEDIDTVKQFEFGRQVFEAFAKEYKKSFINEDGLESELREAQEQKEAMARKYEKAAKQLAVMERAQKMDQVLKPLTGKQREIMETILKNVETDKLEEGYKTFIGRVLKESKVDESKQETSEKETKVLAEGKSDVSTKEEKTVVIKTGDLTESKEEEVPVKKPILESFKKLAGIVE